MITIHGNSVITVIIISIQGDLVLLRLRSLSDTYFKGICLKRNMFLLIMLDFSFRERFVGCGLVYFLKNASRLALASCSGTGMFLVWVLEPWTQIFSVISTAYEVSALDRHSNLALSIEAPKNVSSPLLFPQINTLKPIVESWLIRTVLAQFRALLQENNRLVQVWVQLRFGIYRVTFWLYCNRAILPQSDCLNTCVFLCSLLLGEASSPWTLFCRKLLSSSHPDLTLSCWLVISKLVQKQLLWFVGKSLSGFVLKTLCRCCWSGVTANDRRT